MLSPKNHYLDCVRLCVLYDVALILQDEDFKEIKSCANWLEKLKESKKDKEDPENEKENEDKRSRVKGKEKS